jgi:hypothetical protein
MKILRVLLATSVILPIALVSCENPTPDAIKEQDGLKALIKNGQKGCDGQNGENGQNGGNGGKGGNGGDSNWGNGGNGG